MSTRIKLGKADPAAYKALTSLNQYREATSVTPTIKNLIALTEEVTHISNRVSDKTYNEAVMLLGEEYFARVLMTIIIMNAWNRVGVALEMQPVAAVAPVTASPAAATR